MDPSFAQQINSLNDQLESYRVLINSNLADPTIVHLGNDYFAEVPKTDAMSFLNRRIQTMEEELTTLCQLEGLNDEGLPIYDVVEELDDNGNVVDAKVNRTGLSAHFSQLSLKNDHEKKSNPDPLAIRAKEVFEPAPDPAETSNDVQGSSNSADYVQHIEGASDNDHTQLKDIQSKGDFASINPEDILELEIFADEDSNDDSIDFDFDDLEEEENGYHDDGSNKNYNIVNGYNDLGNLDDSDDYNNDDGEGDDDEGDDEDAFGLNLAGGLFPQDEATQKLIEAHLSRNNPSNVPDDLVKRSQKSAHVHFAEKVDVHEFETSPEERKRIPYSMLINKPSRFKLCRKKNQTGKAQAPVTTSLPSTSNSQSVRTTSAAAAAAKAVTLSPRKDEVSNSPVHGQVLERNITKSPAKETTASSSSAILPSKANATHSTLTNGSRAIQPPSLQSNIAEHVNVTESEEDDDRKAKLIKSKVDLDAAKIFEESFVPDQEFLKLHDSDFQHNLLNPKPSQLKLSMNSSSPSSDQPILSHTVKERPDTEESENYDEIDEVDMKEIKKEYQRLRQKLIYSSGGYKKTDREKAIEPVSENGAPKKISRFKAAHLV